MGDATCPFCAEPIAAGAARCDACGERQDGAAAAPARRGGAGLIIGVVVAVCVGGVCLIGVLAALLMPALTKAKSKANRTKCSNNLRQVGLAMIMYADDKRFYPHVGPTGSLDGDVTSSDSPRSARALLYYGYHDAPSGWICPDSYDLAWSGNAPTAGVGSPATWFWAGGTVPASGLSPFVDGQRDPALDQTDELSYGWTRRGLNSNTRATATLSADRARRSDPAATDVLAGNHADGWNVGYADGTVTWVVPALPAADALTSTDAADPEAGFLSIEDPASR
jgi:type II secretory pathway pseudopilin PulG